MIYVASIYFVMLEHVLRYKDNMIRYALDHVLFLLDLSLSVCALQTR